MKIVLIAAAVATLSVAAPFTTAAQEAANTQPAAGASTAPATQPGAQQRSIQEVAMDLQMTSQMLGEAIGGPDRLFDAQARQQDAETVVPIAQRLRELMEEATQYPMFAAQVDPSQMDSLLVLYGDEQAEQRLQQAADGEGEAAVNAQISMIEVEYIRAEDESGRLEQVQRLVELTGENASSERVASAYIGLAGMPFTGDAEFAALKEGAGALEGPLAADVQAQLDAADAARNMPQGPEEGEGPQMENPAGTPTDDDEPAAPAEGSDDDGM